MADSTTPTVRQLPISCQGVLDSRSCLRTIAWLRPSTTYKSALLLVDETEKATVGREMKLDGE